ncbi:MAG TPA: sortase [Patescibacteria group bacterium]|nr:sortase [Patescibacteria group bacterium]
MPRGFRLAFSNLLILVGFVLLILTYGPLIKDEFWYMFKELKSQKYVLNDPRGTDDSAFARFLTNKSVSLKPVNTSFSVVIEKIGVNAPIVADVSVTDKNAYMEALKSGIAHASVSDYPSEKPGNVYLFAHASIDFWRLGRYATVFNLLRKMEKGDKVHVFYKGDDYIYEVINKEVQKGFNTFPLTRTTIEPILTLQTCDPPGTTLNRLIVTAKLVKVEK